MSPWTVTIGLSFGCVVVLYLGQRAFRSRTPRQLPPGPPGLPWVGSIIGINTSAPWITYTKWARTYGDIVYVRQFGNDVIIINSEKIAKDLLEKRAKNYSNRPCIVTAEMCGVEFHSALLPYGEQWRLHRRLFHQTFRANAVPRFLPLQHRKTGNLLQQLLSNPERLDDHVFEYTASVILNSTYDYDPASRKDELVDILADVLEIVSLAVRPDISVILGAVPLLHHLPSWFPGMSFKRQMALALTLSKRYLEQPFQHSLQRLACSSSAPSLVRDALGDIKENGALHEETWIEDLKRVSGSALVAASDTSRGVLMAFFLMMVLNPVAQEKAQAQIDTVVGKNRLPGIEDRPLLPFVDAIFWEVLRCCPVLPLSIPHAAVDDDVYDGLHIPKGAIVIVNVWSMAHDESRYPNSHAFIPERFLNDDGSLKPNDINHITFGFGRRICVGRHFADMSVWSVIAKVLAVFRILKPLDENGMEVPVKPKFSSGLSAHPLPFGHRIVPRVPGMDAERLEQLIAASTT